MPTARVIVIGAGMSGLAAARTLADDGFQVAVVEARERIGGRIWTDHSLGLPVDLGASWIHGRIGNPIDALAREFGIKTLPTSYENVAIFDKRGKRLRGLRKLALSARPHEVLKRMVTLADTVKEDISVGEAIRLSLAGMQLNDDELCYLNKFFAEFQLINAADVEDQSLWSLMKFPPGVKGRDVLFPEGYAQIAEQLAKGLDIKYQQPVVRIEHGSDRILVETTKGAYEADAAIVTLSVGVLKTGAVKFEPALPLEKREAIDAVPMGLMNKVVLRFSDVFWPRHQDFIEFAQETAGPFHAFLNAWKYSGDPMLVTFAAGRQAELLESKTDKEITALVMSVLRKLPRAGKVEPTSVKVTRWGQDKFAGGSYSVVPLGASSTPFVALGQSVGRLFFAGEATDLIHQGTVHGAYLSGLRAAGQVKECAWAVLRPGVISS